VSVIINGNITHRPGIQLKPLPQTRSRCRATHRSVQETRLDLVRERRGLGYGRQGKRPVRPRKAGFGFTGRRRRGSLGNDGEAVGVELVVVVVGDVTGRSRDLGRRPLSRCDGFTSVLSVITVIPPAHPGNRGQTLSFSSARQPRSGPPMTLIEVLSRRIPRLSLLILLRDLRSLMLRVVGITFESRIRIPRNLRVPIDVIMSAYQFLSPEPGAFTSLLCPISPCRCITGNVRGNSRLIDALPAMILVGRSSTFPVDPGRRGRRRRVRVGASSEFELFEYWGEGHLAIVEESRFEEAIRSGGWW
jgi:hypothetical protein